MLTVVLILIVVACLLLTLLVLIQNPKGGIAANFVAPSQIVGVKRSTDLVEKATWVMAIALVSLSLLSNFFRPAAGTGTDVATESRIKNSIEEQTVPAAPMAPQPAQTEQ
ncbi:MAG: preprotein translocase subunit SecG, partial [Bacteroidia bacterium]|nr:preprotein translocase subunit SecG [Bacteroidia bacterium]